MHPRLLLVLLSTLLCAGHGAAAGPPAAGADVVRPDGVTEHWHADFLLDTRTTPPPDTADWRRVTLPDRWRDPARFERADAGWYRLRLAGPEAPDARWAILLWRVNMNAQVWVNGVWLGTGGRTEKPVARNWNRPLLMEVPATLWRPGPDEILIRLQIHPHFGTLAPVLVGPRAALVPDYQRLFFWQITVNQALFVFTLALAAMSLGFWLRRRQETAYLYLAAACLAWSAYSLHLFIREIPVSAQTWWKCVHFAIDLFSLLLVPFAHRFAGVERPRVELAVATLVVGIGCVYASVDLAALIPVAARVHALMLVVPVYLIGFLVRQLRRHWRSDLAGFLAALLLLLAFGIHDVWLTSRAGIDAWREAVFLTPFGAPALFVTLAWHLTGRFSAALRVAERAREELERRVEDATRRLEAVWAERNRLATREATALERERIHRDLHDDLGARLLSLVYALQDRPEQTMAREALSDLRVLVSPEPGLEDDFVTSLIAWREETDARLAAAGVALDWEVPDPVAALAPPPLVRHHLTRMLRELTTNVLRHADARQVRVRFAADPDDALVVTFEDDGRGIEEAAAGGRGLRNLHARARLLGGRVRLEHCAAGTGCRMTLRIPGARACEAPSPDPGAASGLPGSGGGGTAALP